MIYQSVTALYSGKATRSFEYRKASERKKKKKKEKEKLHEFGWELLPHPHHIPRTCSVGISSSSSAANTFFFFFFADKKLWKYRGLRGSCNESYSFLRGWATFVPRTDCYEQGGIWAIITLIMESFLLRVMQGEININESMIATFLICLKWTKSCCYKRLRIM